MKKLFVACMFARAFTVAGAPSAAAAYDNTACLTSPVPWTNDACAGTQWGH